MPSEFLFPHLTSTGPAPSYRDVVSTYRSVLSSHIANGSYKPLVLPYHLYGGFALMLYLCIPHVCYPWVYGARWMVLGGIIWFQVKILREASSESAATAFACGLYATWGMVWAVVWLGFRRPQWDARRVQRRRRRVEGVGLKGRGITEGADRAGDAMGIHKNGKKHEQRGKVAEEVENENGHLRNRTAANGQARPDQGNGHIGVDGTVNGTAGGNADNDVEYFWEPYPDNLLERIPWVMDLVMNFRGPGWNWAIPPLPDIPAPIKKQLGEPINTTSCLSTISRTGIRQFSTRRELFTYIFPRFIAGYLMLDILKTTMMKDPYYIFGPNTYSLPPHLASLSPTQLFLYRQLLTCLGVITALQMAFALVPLSTCLLSSLSSLPQDQLVGGSEPWYYPTFWGSFSSIPRKGLNGLWGTWWHQTFRFAFAAPSNYLIEHGYVDARSRAAKLWALVTAFGISGVLHLGGSITQVPRTKPWNAVVYFGLQAVGILMQDTVSSSFRGQIDRLPMVARRAGNFLFTLVWMMSTSWLLVDDFSRGGIWLCEPIPISLLRGLGYGVEGDGWWCWEHIGVGWHRGKHWWESGIAL